MPVQNSSLNEPYDITELSFIIESILIEHFKHIHGSSPTLAELRQHLVFTGINKLVEYIRAANSDLRESYSKSELVHETQLYIRHLH